MSRIVTLFVLALAGTVPAYGAPVLQLYIEGADYNAQTETWTLAVPGSSSGDSFRLWTIGNVDGPGGKGTISSVRLAVSYDSAHQGLSLSLDPTRVGGVGSFNGVSDPSVPTDPVLNTTVDTSLGTVNTGPSGEVTNGGAPVLSNGKVLPSHGEFGPSIFWQEYSLGDFSATDSDIGDFIGDFPSVLHPNSGQINAYDISVLSGHGATLHFDLYDGIGGANGARFAPFSHDSKVIPEPASVVVWCGIGVFGFVATRWRRKKRLGKS